MSKTSKPKKSSKKRKCDMDAKEIVANESKSKKLSKKRLLDDQSKTLNSESKGIREKNRGKGKSKLKVSPNLFKGTLENENRYNDNFSENNDNANSKRRSCLGLFSTSFVANRCRYPSGW